MRTNAENARREQHLQRSCRPMHIFHNICYRSQSRPNIFDLEIRRPDLLYKAIVEVDERIVLDKDGEGGWERDPELSSKQQQLKTDATDADNDQRRRTAPSTIGETGNTVVQGLTGEGVRVVKEPDLDAVRSSLQGVLDQGITSLAVVFLHR